MLFLNKHKYKLKALSVHRNDDHNELLEKEGSSKNLNQKSENFEEEFRNACKELNVKVFFDCVGGEVGEKILLNLPFYSTLYIYGVLGGHKISVDIIDTLYKSKKIHGYVFYTLMSEEFAS